MTSIESEPVSVTPHEAGEEYKGLVLILGDPNPDDDPARLPSYPPLTPEEREAAIKRSIEAAAKLAISKKVPDHLLWAHNTIHTGLFPSV